MILPDADILLMLHVTGVAYGSVVSPPAPVQDHKLAPVVHGVSIILVMSFPVGADIVIVESVIVAFESVVGAVNDTIGGNLIVVDAEFPAVSYAVTTMVCTGVSSGSSVKTTGLVAGLIVVSVPVPAHPSSAL